jgi:hypothetical protein
VDSVKLGERRGRKIWNQPFFEHHPMGNSLQDRTVLSVVCIRHNITFSGTGAWSERNPNASRR